MEDLGENTTVLSSLRSLNNFISQRMEGTSGLDVSTSASGSLQKQYEYHMQVSGPLCVWEYTWLGGQMNVLQTPGGIYQLEQ
jgi:hypothetical protein